MLARSNSMILSIPVKSFDYMPMPRSKEPEIFTFEPVPVQAPQRSTTVRHRRKNTRVMYPAGVRKYLPPAEKSPAKRWLFILCLVVFLQIYTEETNVETTTASAVENNPAGDAPSEDLSFAQYQLLPFLSAEQQAREMKSQSGAEGQQQKAWEEEEETKNVPEQSVLARVLNWTCPRRGAEVAALYEQSRRNSYFVALLYPVYHRLGSEK